MVSVYSAIETDFSHNGIRVIDNILKSCYVIEEINCNYNLEIEVVKDELEKSECLQGLNIIKADNQLFRIPFITNEQAGFTKKIVAPHIFYDLNNDFNGDTRASNKSVEDALKIATAINLKFTVLECDNLGLNNANFIEESPSGGIFNKILPRWGGELYRDNYNLAIKKRLGKDTGRLISYGKDIVGFTQTLDYSKLATRILLKGKDGLTIDLVNGGSKYLTSPRVNDYPFIITKKVEFTDIESATELKNKGLSLWGTIDILQANYKINMVDISKTKEYKQFEQLLELKLGDTIIIRHKIFKVDLLARVIKIKKNILTNMIEEIELGQFKSNLATHFNKIDNKISYVEMGVQEAKEDLKITKTTVFQNNEQISLQAEAITNLDERVDNAELKITASAIVSTVRSSTEYTNDLGQKITSAQASTISQTASNVKIGFNGISDVVEIKEDGIKVSHGGTDYTHMGATGFKRHVGTSDKDYHYLTYVGQVDIYSTPSSMGSAVIQLPDEFKNKNFYVTTSFNGASTTDGYAHAFYGFGSFVEGGSAYDIINARFTIYARASWDVIGNVKNQISYTVIA